METISETVQFAASAASGIVSTSLVAGIAQYKGILLSSLRGQRRGTGGGCGAQLSHNLLRSIQKSSLICLKVKFNSLPTVTQLGRESAQRGQHPLLSEPVLFPTILWTWVSLGL